MCTSYIVNKLPRVRGVWFLIAWVTCSFSHCKSKAALITSHQYLYLEEGKITTDVSEKYPASVNLVAVVTQKKGWRFYVASLPPSHELVGGKP